MDPVKPAYVDAVDLNSADEATSTTVSPSPEINRYISQQDGTLETVARSGRRVRFLDISMAGGTPVISTKL